MFTVREATIADADATARVHTLSWQTSYRGILPAEVLDALDVNVRAEKRRARMENATGVYLVGCDAAGEIVGFCDAGPSREPGEIRGEVYAIYLLDSAKRSGLGRALFDGAMTWLRDRSLLPVSVWVFEDNPGARRFYQAMGGQLEGRSNVTIGDDMYMEVSYVWR